MFITRLFQLYNLSIRELEGLEKSLDDVSLGARTNRSHLSMQSALNPPMHSDASKSAAIFSRVFYAEYELRSL